MVFYIPDINRINASGIYLIFLEVTDLRGPTPDVILIKYTGFISGLLDINRRPPVFVIFIEYTEFGPTPDVILIKCIGFISGPPDVNCRPSVFETYLSGPSDDLILLIISCNDIIIGFFFGRLYSFFIIITGAISTASFLLISIKSVSTILLLLAGFFSIIIVYF
jgi:hypothetical protein